MFFLYTLSLLLVVLPPDDRDTPTIALGERLRQSYAELLETTECSSDSLKLLRNRIERERDDRIENAKKTERQLTHQLDAARSELESLNKRTSVDSTETGKRRSELHTRVSTLERRLREESARQQVISQDSERELVKLWLIERWPDKRAEVLRRIEEGRSRERRHGDVDDIGYRRIAEELEKDIEVGQQASRQMMAGGWLPSELQNAGVQNYVRRLAGRIAASSDLNIPLHVTVLDSRDLKVVALPGGFLYVTTGAIMAAHTESEFAGVLSREIARIAARHAVRASKRSVISKMFVPVAQVATGIFSGGVNPGAYYGIGYGVQGLGSVVDHMFEGAKTEYQKEADQLGVQYAWKAGFDPKGFIMFMDTAPSDFVGSDPAVRERLLNLFTEVAYLPELDDPVVNSAEFRRIRGTLIETSGK